MGHQHTQLCPQCSLTDSSGPAQTRLPAFRVASNIGGCTIWWVNYGHLIKLYADDMKGTVKGLAMTISWVVKPLTCCWFKLVFACVCWLKKKQLLIVSFFLPYVSLYFVSTHSVFLSENTVAHSFMVNHHMFHWTCYSISWKYPPFSDPYIISSSLWHLSHSVNPCQPSSISHWIQCSMVISTMWNHIEYYWIHLFSMVKSQLFMVKSQCFFLTILCPHELPERAPFFSMVKFRSNSYFLGFFHVFPMFS